MASRGRRAVRPRRRPGRRESAVAISPVLLRKVRTLALTSPRLSEPPLASTVPNARLPVAIGAGGIERNVDHRYPKSKIARQRRQEDIVGRGDVAMLIELPVCRDISGQRRDISADDGGRVDRADVCGDRTESQHIDRAGLDRAGLRDRSHRQEGSSRPRSSSSTSVPALRSAKSRLPRVSGNGAGGGDIVAVDECVEGHIPSGNDVADYDLNRLGR